LLPQISFPSNQILIHQFSKKCSQYEIQFSQVSEEKLKVPAFKWLFFFNRLAISSKVCKFYVFEMTQTTQRKALKTEETTIVKHVRNYFFRAFCFFRN